MISLNDKIKFHSLKPAEKITHYAISGLHPITNEYSSNVREAISLRTLMNTMADVNNDAYKKLEEDFEKAFEKTNLFIGAILESPSGQKFV